MDHKIVIFTADLSLKPPILHPEVGNEERKMWRLILDNPADLVQTTKRWRKCLVLIVIALLFSSQGESFVLLLFLSISLFLSEL